MKFCFGNVFNLIFFAKVKGYSDVSVMRDIAKSFGVVNADNMNFNVGMMKSFKINASPYLRDSLVTFEGEKVAEGLCKNLKGHIPSRNISKLHYSILQLLKDDLEIDGSDLIGPTDGPAKEELLQYDDSKFYFVLANVLFYCIQNKNTFHAGSIKKTNLKYYENAEQNFKPKLKQQTEISISSTVKPEGFGNTFTLIAECPFKKIIDTAKLKIYCLDIQNRHFNYEALVKFVRRNVSHYIFSRNYIARMVNDGDIELIGKEAFTQFKSICEGKQEKKRDFLANILLYVFLEEVLRAKKIFTRYEQLDNETFYSDGVYLLSNNLGQSHELVFGAAAMTDNLNDVADKVISKVIRVIEHSKSEVNFVNGEIFKDKFSAGQIQFLRSILLPQIGSTKVPDHSFGCFLGYTFDNSEIRCGNREYRYRAVELIKADAKKLCEYLAKQICDKDLQEYSFYFYILPFNDALKDVEKIYEDF